ncbi:MAG: hypothetical protein E7I55_15350 [Acinetobacter ursingii]|nr:hypothetical protein [Acinetobacter ursingii]
MESNESTLSPSNDERILNAQSSCQLITEEDLFKILKKKYHVKFSTLEKDTKIRSGVFYETICMLEDVEKGLKKIRDRAYPTRDDFLLARSHENKTLMQNIVNFYWSLTIDKKLLEFVRGGYHFSKNFSHFINYIYLYKKKYPEERMPFWKSDDRWNIFSFPEQEVFDFLEQYVLDLEVVVIDRFNRIPTTTKSEGEQTETENNGISENTPAPTNSVDPWQQLDISFYKKFEDTITNFHKLIEHYKKLVIIT